MTKLETLKNKVETHCGDSVLSTTLALNELTVEVSASKIREVCTALRDKSEFGFDMLIDVCGVDYLKYGMVQWSTEDTTETGFSRGVDRSEDLHETVWEKPRFAVVYHLLSVKNNQRIRLRAFPEGEPPVIDSITDIWNAANWFEREAFDLFGILFKGHPDLRRILTDYDFDGHPFRKDFPLIGKVAMRYDAKAERCVYEPVAIQPRTLVPKVIRDDSRYLGEVGPEKHDQAKQNREKRGQAGQVDE